MMPTFWLAGAAIFCFAVAGLAAAIGGTWEAAVGWLGLALLTALVLATARQRS